MTRTEFSTFADLVKERSGIHLSQPKFELLRARLGKRLRALKLPNVRAYMGYLQEDQSGLELERLVDVVTTNKTEFFRESRHYAHLASEAIPQFLASFRGKAGEPFRIWSAACSSGEEPYTLAMVLEECLRGRAPYKILATDISSRMLQKAAEGRYTLERMQGVPAQYRQRFFERVDEAGESYFLAGQELKQHVTFSRFNLNDPAQYVFSKGFHAIFCRNVMIYFDQPTQEAVVASLSGQLLPAGLLYTGLSESLVSIRHNLKAVGASVYRKPSAGERP